MKKSITLVDFSHLAMRNLFIAIGQANPTKKDGLFITQEFMPYFKSLLFNSLQFIKNKFKNEIILATDGKKNWRKLYYPDYKANRSITKNDSDVNFEEFFEELDLILEAIKENFPFKVLAVEEAEADDIAGVISINHGDELDITLVTSDHDWLQVQAHNKIRVWDPIKKEDQYLTEFDSKIIETCDGPVSRFTLKHALIGDKGDNVPTITGKSYFSDNFITYLKEKDITTSCVKTVQEMTTYSELIEKYEIYEVFKSGHKKGQSKETKDIFKTKPFGIKKAEAAVEKIENLRDLLDSHNMYRDNFIRNRTLVDFTKIPMEVHDNIMENFSNAEIIYNPNGMLEYFMNEKLGLHVSNINKFYSSKYDTKTTSSLDDFLEF